MKIYFTISLILISLVSFPSWGEIQKPMYFICHGIIKELKPAGTVRNETKTFILQQHERYGYPQYVLWSDIGMVEDCQYNTKEITCGEPPNSNLNWYIFQLDRVDGSIDESIFYREDSPMFEMSTSFSGQCKIKNKPEI